jgi:hypothetical protein
MELCHGNRNHRISSDAAMNDIDFHMRGKYANVAGSYPSTIALSGPRYAIEQGPKYNSLSMHDPPHSSFRTDLPRAESKVADAKMPNRATQLASRFQLHDLEVSPTGSLAQIIRPTYGHNFH